MKRFLLITILLISFKGVFAQGIFHYYTGLILPDKDAPLKADRFGVDLYYNSWLNLPPGIKTSPKSIGVNLFRIYDIPFGHSPFGCGFGFGLSSHNVHHNGSFVEQIDVNTGEIYTSLNKLPENYEYRKNKVSINYFEIPFELRFRTKKKFKTNMNPRGPFRIYPGFKVGYLVNIHSSVKNNDGKYKYYNYAHLDKVRYGATLRIGYGRTSLYGFYSLTNLFKEGKGVELQSYAVGLSFMAF